MSLSILLATYNGEKYLKEQLDSILRQTTTNWHLYIHDDNSTDDTVHIIKEFISRYPEKMTHFDDEISFGSALANFGYLMEKVSSEHLMFCDQDDVWKRDKIEITLEQMKEAERLYHDKPILVHTDLEVVDEKLNSIDNSLMHYQNLNPAKKSFSNLVIQNNITGCTVMINRALADMALPIPREAVMHDWWIALVASAFGEIVFVPASTICYRQHSANDTGAKAFDIGFLMREFKGLLHSDKEEIFGKYLLQAEKFLERYGDRLDSDKKMALEDFCTIYTQTKLQRITTITKHRFYKQGLLRNIGLFLRV